MTSLNQKDSKVAINKKNHASQAAQGNRDEQVKLSAHNQTRKVGNRPSGNKGQDTKNSR